MEMHDQAPTRSHRHQWQSGRCERCGQDTFFAVPAREMLFDVPEACPAYGGLTFDGIAVTDDDHSYLIFRLSGGIRAYFGPDRQAVARTGAIMIAALRRCPAPPRVETQPAIMVWLMTCWDVVTDEIASARYATAVDLKPIHSVMPTFSTQQLSVSLGGSR